MIRVDAETLRAEQEALRQEMLIQEALKQEAILHEQEALQKAEALKLEQTVTEEEKESTALKILQELIRAEREKMANTNQVPVAYRNLGNQPVGGEWAGSVYVQSNNPGSTYDPTQVTSMSPPRSPDNSTHFCFRFGSRSGSTWLCWINE